jgi:hypothetical protein
MDKLYKIPIAPCLGDYVVYRVHFNDTMNTPPTEDYSGIVIKRSGRAPQRRWDIRPSGSSRVRVLRETALLSPPDASGHAKLIRVCELVDKYKKRKEGG